ncbi:hypothetical protein FKG94_12390 [Exilibacterium tricleocarpae]|uniref:Porin n=1 Tax=Exilibacterium tricleocarpae TaxID=2591008 RepID=A0A545TNM2_9GAMM|nr:hypothetical protein [Exilibacterium tricleocarpae]TQV78814.1 hypothetical protein FKG94_12390 [Exilibacterium tricleocarpae]
MPLSLKPAIAGLALALCIAPAGAIELTGRASLLGLVAKPAAGDSGFIEGESEYLTADQIGLRLMLDEIREHAEWSVHVRTTRQHFDGFPSAAVHSSDLFRYQDLRDNWLDQRDDNGATRAGIELDHAYYKRQVDNFTFTLGRQPVDWGSGRLWQPLNLFGAFAPTDLDTDYKPGIDGVTLDWYPSPHASVTTAYIVSPQGDAALEDSLATYYRRQVGEQSEIGLAAGSISGNQVVGGSFESAWRGIGWRIEGAHYDLEESDDKGLFYIAGIDYQFEEGTLLALEWYHNHFGVKEQMALADEITDPLVVFQLQPLLGRRALGISVNNDITPLLRGTYLLLASSLKDMDNDHRRSFMHQVNFVYSVSDEADFLVSALWGTGDGLDDGRLRSEFGHVPKSLTLRFRYYF